MREIFTYGSVGGAPGNRCFYLEPDWLTRPIFRYLSIIISRPTIPVNPWPAGDLERCSRHEVAFLYVISAHCLRCAITRHVPAGILRRHAAVALMTGCEAFLTTYRIGKETVR